MDAEMQELFDAAKNYVDHITGESPNFVRLQTAVGALESKSTAQILNDVQAAITDCNLVHYLLDSDVVYKTLSKALGEAIQAWNDAQ